MKYSALILVCSTTLALAACSSGGTSVSDDVTDTVTGSGDSGTIDTTTPTNTPTTAAVLTGRFVDAAVSGLQYTTASQSGVTDSDGSFDYLAGESVTFSLGDIMLPAVQGADVVTPLDVFATDNIADISVINLTRLLQSLDVDATPTNGITVSDTAVASATGLSVDFASADFDSQVTNLVANSGSSNTALIDGQTALAHFQETLFDEGIEERPTIDETPDTEPTSGNTSLNPLVGTTAEFSNPSIYNIGGTVTILDDRTLQVTDFTYNGGGPSVFFYLGNNGDYSPSGGGVLIGNQLNGRSFNGETMTLTLPPNVTLDDFDGVSVWCDIFFINFGDARF